MKLVHIDYNPETDAVEVFVSGCTRRCAGCHNERLWNFDLGHEWTTMLTFLENTNCDRIMIMGGEPLDQDITQLCMFLDFLDKHYKEIWLFTGYESVPQFVCDKCNFVKVGPYKEDLPEWIYMGITLASNNQMIYKGERGWKSTLNK